MNNEIKSIIAELEVIYGFYQDKFSLKRIKDYVLSMPEGSHLTTAELGKVSLYDHDVILPIGAFNDQSDPVSLLQVTHTTINNRKSDDIANDSRRVAELVTRLIVLINPSK